MGLLKIILLCTFLILSACNKGSNSAEKNPHANKIDANRTCVPENELLAANIIGGHIVQPSDKDSKTVMMLVSGGMVCTAVAIDKKVLLTAAHCIAGNKKNSYVSFYPSVSCESGYNSTKYTQGISELIVHTDYDPKADAKDMIADIALVILEEELPSGYSSFKIANPVNDQLADLYFFGYGRTGSHSGGARILRKTALEQSLYRISFSANKVEINQRGGSGICKGDSGGPSFVNVEGEMQILGISSYVVGPENDVCAQDSYQTLVSSYKSWIESKLKELKK
ncbi:MAG: trypsin-like serine protease [Bdellovibrionota bacterium]